MLDDNYINFIKEELRRLKSGGLFRELRCIENFLNEKIIIGGKTLINFASNNYLGLAKHPQIIKETISYLERWGCSATASRLVSGNFYIHEELEDIVAKFVGKPTALLYNCGYMANIGVITTLVSKEDIIFADKLAHASIIDGCLYSKAKLIRFAHNDMNNLEYLLKKYINHHKKLIVTESVFSMEGDIVPLKDLVYLAKKYGCILMLDEAHALGIFGKTGGGIAQSLGLTEGIDIIMATFGKALGSFGAFVAVEPLLREYFINKSRHFIFTTALPPFAAAASISAIKFIQDNLHIKDTLLEKASFLREKLKECGFSTMNSQSQIIPLLLGDNIKAQTFSQALFKEGIFTPAIRPPTVPWNTSRLRINIIATHTYKDLEFLISKIKLINL